MRERRGERWMREMGEIRKISDTRKDKEVNWNSSHVFEKSILNKSVF